MLGSAVPEDPETLLTKPLSTRVVTLATALSGLLAAGALLASGPLHRTLGPALLELRRAAELDARPAEEVAGACRKIARKLASVSLDECLERRLEASGGRSIGDQPILLREYPPLGGREPVGRVLLFGGIHGDEYSSVTIVFKWLEILDQFHSGMFHWRIVPVLNPDGLLRQPSQRMNERGVDLNRNFPSPDWFVEAEDYWVRRTSRNPRRYPGTAPLSEPESRWLAEEIERFRPGAIVAVHAPVNVVDFDGPQEPPSRLGPLYLQQMGTYPGSLGRYAGVHKGLPVLTIELPSAGIMPTADEQQRIWIDLVAWLKDHLPRTDGFPAGLVAAAGSGPAGPR